MPASISSALGSSSAALIKLGRALMGSGEGAKAVALFDGLMNSRGHDADLASAARIVLSHGIPQWHATMLNDTVRNDAYERAIRRTVTPETTVLDIGSGSGLLAMMAARAGARHVYTCELNPAVAETAREIVAANGFADRITVLAGHSTGLDAERDLGGRVDVVVSEIFGNDLLCEGALASLDHAAEQLARPGATFIPFRASLRVALASFDKPSLRLPAQVSGFDLTRFDRHLTSHRSLPVGNKRLSLCSPAHDLLTFTFGQDAPPHPARADLRIAAPADPANGLVQWIAFDLDDQDRYENAPSPGRYSAWGAIFHTFPDELGHHHGRDIHVHADHDGEFPRIWFTTA
jgi:type II protein arginine methyltransferase